MTIRETFDSFLETQEQRLKPRTYSDYDSVIELFAHSLHTPKGRAIRKELDILGMIDPGDPPVFLCNIHPNIDLEDGGDVDHHPRHAIALKKKCDEMVVEAVLVTEYGPRVARDSYDFLLRHFGMK